MKRMVVGYLFTEDLSEVVLIQKKRPDWQAGKFNGVGGHIEPSDGFPIKAMIREFKEETGIEFNTWEPLGVMQGGFSWKLYLFTGQMHGLTAGSLQTLTDEVPKLVPVNALPNNIVGNLIWMVPLARDKFRDISLSAVRVTYIK